MIAGACANFDDIRIFVIFLIRALHGLVQVSGKAICITAGHTIMKGGIECVWIAISRIVLMKDSLAEVHGFPRAALLPLGDYQPIIVPAS
jgi:hypothetical protein